jgi:hypothetical protein
MLVIIQNKQTCAAVYIQCMGGYQDMKGSLCYDIATEGMWEKAKWYLSICCQCMVFCFFFSLSL